MKVGLVGCGFMGEAMLNATIARNVVAPADVFVAEINEDRCAVAAGKYGVRATADLTQVVDDSELVIFAVKPQEFARTAHRVEGRFRREQTILSIMAGVPIAKIAHVLSHAAIVRAMPNTPAAIGEGMSVWTATPEVDPASRAFVSSFLGALGREAHVEDESYLDMATALSGSGPGFVFLLLEAFIDAGVQVGFKPDVAEKLAVQTFIGSAKYAEATGKHPAVLRNEVTSPAGTTAASSSRWRMPASAALLWKP